MKGILFCGTALFAVRMGLGLSQQEPNRKQVLETLFAQPWGRISLCLITIALAAHTLWRVVETATDPYQKGTSAGGLLHRFTYLLSGLSYGSLAITAFKLLFGKEQGADNPKQLWVAQLLHREGGEWLVVVAGSISILWAMVQLKKSWTPGLFQSLQTEHLGAFWRWLIRLAGGIGLMTQAAILSGIGYYLLRAAWTRNPRHVKNMDDLLEMIMRLPYGTTWLFLLAGGLFLLGLFMFVMARYFPLKVE